MKTLLLLLFPFLCFCQETTTYQVYETKNGVEELAPTKIIEVSSDKTEIYDTTNGFKNITPSQVIEGDKVYDYTNGFQNIVPTLIIKSDEKSNNSTKSDSTGD